MSVHKGAEVVGSNLSLYVDAENLRSWSYNVHPYPKNIGAWATSGLGANCTVSRDLTFLPATESPVAGVPLKMIVTGADPHIATSNVYLAPAAVSQTWTSSVYAKANTDVSGELFIFGLDSSNNLIEIPSTAINITTEWQRFSYTYTFTNALTTGIAIRLDGPGAGTASTIWWDGLQVEKNSAATPFTSKTNVYGNKISSIGCIPESTSTLVGATTHSNVSPKTFNTNATVVTQANYIGLGTTYNFADASEYSFEFVVKLRSSAEATFHSLAGSGTTNPWLTILTNNTVGNSWSLRYRSFDSVYHNFTDITTYNIQQEWAHITVTVDSSRVCRFYLNGIYQSNVTPATTVFSINRIAGGYESGSNFYSLQGSLAQCRLYTKALTAGEVKLNFASSRSRFSI